MDHRAFEAKRVRSGAAGLTLAILLAACGSDPVTRPPDPPSAAPLPPPTVASTGQRTLEAHFIGRPAPFTTAVTGTLEATVDWTFATNNIDVFIARGDCTPQQFVDAQCNVAASATSNGVKPRRVTLTGAAPGVYSLLIGNAGPDRESLSWQVVLTPTAASSSASPGTGSFGPPAMALRYRPGTSW